MGTELGMETQFTEKELGECLELVIDHRGKTPKKLGADWVDSGIPTISAKNVNGGRLVATDDIRHVSHDVYKRWMKEDVKRGDCFLVSEGATLGECMMWDYDYPIVLGQRIFCLRANPTVLYPRYLYAYMTSASFQSEIIGRATGTSVDGLRQTEVLKLKLRLPPLAQQRHIGDTLYNLDKKIELNRRMNATLEAMARALFQSWFVDFDPVRAKLDGRPPAALDPATAALFPDSFQDSPLGHIPQGWKVGKLGQFTQVGIGGAWGEESPNSKANVAVRCLRGIDCHDLAERKLPEVPIRHLSERQFADRKLKEGCILVEGSGSFCGRSMVWLPEFERLVSDSVCYSNFCKRLDPLCSPSQALVCWMQLRAANDTGELANFRTGTAFPNFDIHGALLGLDVVCPPKEICDRYMELYRSWLRLDLVEESRTLATLRDTLLPKLLSGELSVAEAAQAATTA